MICLTMGHVPWIKDLVGIVLKHIHDLSTFNLYNISKS